MENTTNKASRGCVTSIAMFIVAIIVFSLLSNFLNVDIFTLFIVSYVVASVIVKKFTSEENTNSTTKSVLRYLGVAIVAMPILYAVLMNYEPTKSTQTTKKETTETEVIENGNQKQNLIAHQRVWVDNYGKHYNAKLKVREQDYQQIKGDLTNFRSKSYYTFWYDLYSFMYNKNKTKLDYVYKAFQEIKTKKKLNARDFAEMVVTCVQDIPYALVLVNDCNIDNLDSESLKDVLRRCKTCCIGNVRYGVQQPIAFVGNLKGDCDTRTLLIFTILKHFGYDVAILNSEYYRHSILGLNIPATGLYKTHKGKKYYLWETTAKHCKLGYLAPNFKDVKHWNVIITSK